jgi:hypothetical protein
MIRCSRFLGSRFGSIALFSALFTVSFAGGAGSAAAKQKVAVLGIEPQDQGGPASQRKTADLAKALTEALRSRVTQGTTTYDIAPNSSKELAEVKLLSDCLDEAVGCMTSIGQDLGAEVVLYGHLEKRKNEYIVSMRSLVVATRKPGPIAFNKTFTAGEANDEGMRRVATQAFGEAVPVETVLIVEANVPSGTVYVNGQPKATIINGTATIKGLPEGVYAIAVEAPDRARQEGKAELKGGSAIHMRVDLEPKIDTTVKKLPTPGPGTGEERQPAPLTPPQPPETEERPGGTARILFWTSLVVTAGGVAAFTITGLQVKSIETEQDDAIKAWNGRWRTDPTHAPFPNDACAEAASENYQPVIDICDRGKSMALLTNVFIGVTAVAAASTAFFYWKGYIQPKSASRETARKRRSAPPPTNVVIAPELYRHGGGIGAVISF